MKWLKYHIAVLIITSGLFACEEEYKGFKADKYAPVFVIEGHISDNKPPYFIKVSQSTKFGDSILFNAITNAQVIISDDKGNKEVLSMEQNGIYRADSIVGEIGHIYNLEVKIDDSIFHSSCRMPVMVIIDSIIPVYFNADEMHKKGYYIKLFGKKPQTDSINYYKCKISKNGQLINNRSNSLLYSDERTEYLQKVELDGPFALNDTVDIEIESITKEIFKYFLDINKIIYNEFFVFRYQQNPYSNISGNALGYFQVSSYKKIRLIIK